MTEVLYCDGGIIGPNPSKIGGTWAWCLIETKTNAMISKGKGLLRPEKLGLKIVSNNSSELWAAIQALSFVDKKWDGIIYTDSMVTLRRLTGSHRFEGVPEWLVHTTTELRKNRKWSVMLVAGHPTKAELGRGYRKNKDGSTTPVSFWNKWCDKHCTAIAKKTTDKGK